MRDININNHVNTDSGLAAEAAPFPHVGWGFIGRDRFRAYAAQYIVDGIGHNQWVEFIADGPREQLYAELAAMPALSERIGAGGIGVTPASQFYTFLPGTQVVDPDQAAAAHIAAIGEALHNGYAGLRTVVDATALARTPQQRDALARQEFLLDRAMTVLPFSSLCAYDVGQLGAHAAGELICLHPEVRAQAPSFRLHAAAGASFALSGDIDAAGDALYSIVLERIWSFTDDDPVVIDTQGLAFITPRQLCGLNRYARADGRHVLLRADRGVVARLGDLLDLTNVALVPPGRHPKALIRNAEGRVDRTPEISVPTLGQHV